MRKQQGFGGVVAFEVTGGREVAWQFINGSEPMSLTANLGDAKTTIVHPASTTHGRLTAGQCEAAGISEGLVRIAVGLEDLEDLQSDCLRGLAALGR
jgi:O-succinylhomoserine sulfhydrylase